MRSSTSLSCRMRSPVTVSRSTGAIPDTSKNCPSFSASWSASDSLRCSSALGYSRSDLPYDFEHLRHAAVDIIGRLDEALKCRSWAGCVGWTQRMNVGGAGGIRDAEQQGDQTSGSQPFHMAPNRFRAGSHGRSPRSLLGMLMETPSGFAHSSELARVQGGWQPCLHQDESGDTMPMTVLYSHNAYGTKPHALPGLPGLPAICRCPDRRPTYCRNALPRPA